MNSAVWQGLERAIESQAPEVAVFIAATETFSRKNIGCSIPESLSRYQEVVKAAHSANLPVRGYISVVAGCPYEASPLICPGSYLCPLTMDPCKYRKNFGFMQYQWHMPVSLKRAPHRTLD